MTDREHTSEPIGATRPTHAFSYSWQVRDRVLQIAGRPLVMGIVNVTPDSFSDGGSFATTEAALAHARQLLEQGADLVDIGGESTRPGAQQVPQSEELRRVLPVIEALAGQTDVPLSVDTSKAEVARCCLAAGAHIVNDVTALGDPEMAAVVGSFRAGAILMHMQGTPQTMQKSPHYDRVVAEVARFFAERLDACVAAGIALEQAVLDPGIGFGKTSEHNLTLLANLHEYRSLHRPICLGVSRKGFIGRLMNDRPPRERLAGSLAALAHAMARGAVHIARVHDVRETRDFIAVFTAIADQETPPAQAGV